MQSGYRTESHRAISAYLERCRDTAVSVKDIYRYMGQKGRGVNISTIYRYLGRLEKEGRVTRYISENGRGSLYQYINGESPCDGHIHLKCVKCGRIIRLDCYFMSYIAEQISAYHGFDIQCKNSVIYGVCKECKAKGV